MQARGSETWHSFLKNFRVAVYKPHEVLLFQGEVPGNTYVIKKGIIKTYNLAESGEEQLIDLSTVGDVFPMPWVLGKMPSSLYYYEALTMCEIYCIPRETYLQFLRNDPEILFEELEQATLKGVGSMLRLNALMQSKATHKILNTLHYLSQTQGTAIKPTIIEINIALTHQDIANLTGLTRETTATEINKLKRQGVLRYQKRSVYQVDLIKLKQLLNDRFIAESQIGF